MPTTTRQDRAMRFYGTKVVTWQSPAGFTLNVCAKCEREFSDSWPKDPHGEEYCQVSEGRHRGQCDLCEAGS